MRKFFEKKKNNKSGFTLVELLVTISMFVIITGVVLVNSNQFDNSVLLRNFTYDIALTIKQAQTYGVNVNENSMQKFDTGYGVYFNTEQSDTNFVLFNDLDESNDPSNIDSNTSNSVTLCGLNSECIKKYSMNKGAHITDICVSVLDNSCNINVNNLSIIFKRPSLEAKIYNSNSLESYKYAKINLASGDGATSSVVITSIGQIYVGEK